MFLWTIRVLPNDAYFPLSMCSATSSALRRPDLISKKTSMKIFQIGIHALEVFLARMIIIPCRSVSRY